MDRQTIINELKGVIGDYLKSRGLDLVDLIYRYEGRDLILRVLADRPEGGISLDECADLNTKISIILDEKDILQSRYILEVSSPGLDRPLKAKSDFLRCVNKKVKIFVKMPINGKTELEGTISKADNDAVYINTEDKTLAIPLTNIIKAKQVISCI
jgi:ribosome maturation factor RimP